MMSFVGSRTAVENFIMQKFPRKCYTAPVGYFLGLKIVCAEESSFTSRSHGQVAEEAEHYYRIALNDVLFLISCDAKGKKEKGIVVRTRLDHYPIYTSFYIFLSVDVLHQQLSLIYLDGICLKRARTIYLLLKEIKYVLHTTLNVLLDFVSSFCP